MDEENNAIAHALLLGQTLLISEDIYKSYTDTGAIHVLSVSGLHVAIFISLFVWLFSIHYPPANVKFPVHNKHLS